MTLLILFMSMFQMKTLSLQINNSSEKSSMILSAQSTPIMWIGFFTSIFIYTYGNVYSGRQAIHKMKRNEKAKNILLKEKRCFYAYPIYFVRHYHFLLYVDRFADWSLG